MESMDTPTGAAARTRIVRRDADPATAAAVVCTVLNTTAGAVTINALGSKEPSS